MVHSSRNWRCSFCGLSVCAEHFGSDANDRNGIAWNDCISIYEVVFVFPLIARFDNTTINMLKNAVLIPISRLPYAVFVLGLSGMCVCVTLLNRTTIMIGAVVWSMIGVSLIVYANSLLLRRMFCPYE